MNNRKQLCICMVALVLPALAAADFTVPIYAVSESGKGDMLGTIVITKAAHGLEFTPSLKGLPPGTHGFHLHANASCDPATVDGKAVAASAAGGHHDPANTNKHGSPTTLDTHLGDLPVLLVDASGMAHARMTAPRLDFGDVSRHALVIHAGGDNYADVPLPFGGGGVRIACGVVEAEGK